jgi:hypothetical protein
MDFPMVDSLVAPMDVMMVAQSENKMESLTVYE